MTGESPLFGDDNAQPPPTSKTAPQTQTTDEAQVPIGPGGADPQLMLPRILNFLRDRDVYRDPQWATNLDAVENYLNEAHNARLRGEIGYGTAWLLAALKQARSLVDLHRQYEKWTTGKTRWSTDILPSVAQTSHRLIGYPKVHPRPPRDNDRSAIPEKRIYIPLRPTGTSPFYTEAPRNPGQSRDAADSSYSAKLRADEVQFWNSLDVHLTNKTGAASGTCTPWNPGEENLYDISNETYEHCIGRGAAETNHRAKVENLDTAAVGPFSMRKPLPRGFARARGIKRAAIQQCLNLFTNHENRVTNTPWRRVILPYDKISMPKEIPFQPRVIEPDRVHHLAKEPFPWVQWYSVYTTYLNFVSASKRIDYNNSNWQELDRSCLPVNFRGPYINEGRSVHDDHWLKVGKYLTDLECYLRDRFAIAPRPLLQAILNDIQAGKLYTSELNPEERTSEDAAARAKQYIQRRDIIRTLRDLTDGDIPGGPDKPRLLDEVEVTWLRFLCEPPRSQLMLEKVDELRQDNLAAIFDNRLQEVLRAYGSWEETDEDPSGGDESISLPVNELLDKINGAETEMLPDDHLRQPNKAYQFSIEEAEHYIRVLARLGRCKFYAADANRPSSVAPANFDLYPEGRVLWRHADAQEAARVNESKKKQWVNHLLSEYPGKGGKQQIGDPEDYKGILEHIQLPNKAASLDTIMAVNEYEAPTPGLEHEQRHDDMKRTILLQLYRHEQHYVPGLYEEDEEQPSFEDLASWDELRQWARSKDFIGTAEETCQFFRNLAYRMGYTIAYYENAKKRLEGLEPLHREDVTRELDHWTSMVDQGDSYQARTPSGRVALVRLGTPSAQAVVDKADPDERLRSQTTDKDPFVLIRKGLIDDCVENRNVLYPGRLTAFRDQSQTPFQGLERPNLFSWATSAQRRFQAPYTRSAFFHMRRWPLHHQNTHVLDWIRNRRDEPLRIDPRSQTTGILTPRIEPHALVPAKATKMAGEQGHHETEYVGRSMLPDDEEVEELLRKYGDLVSPREKEALRKPRGILPGYGRPMKEATGTKKPKSTTTTNKPGSKIKREQQLVPITRPSHEWIPGPAVYPMGDTLLQQLVISQQLENAIYPPDQVPWAEWLAEKAFQITHKPPPKIPLLPNSTRHKVPSSPAKRKLPAEFVTKGPAKRQRPPQVPDGRPDSGKKFDPNYRVFRRPATANPSIPHDIAVAVADTRKLNQSFPSGHLVKAPAGNLKGLDRGIQAIIDSMKAQQPDLQTPSRDQLRAHFNDMATTYTNWFEVRKHNGVEDHSYAGPPFGDQMAGALYYYNQRANSTPVALGIWDSSMYGKPFVYPLPEGQGRSARVVWVFYDGTAAKYRPRPLHDDPIEELNDFGYWSSMQSKPAASTTQ
ncbi:hypothetical protein DL768_004773 [Monosporascus sp. mg162]|nr:hypothetical protein DL768_004773 [Monosporascus sp. mg162]